MAGDASDRGSHSVRLVECAECGELSDAHRSGWRAYRSDDPELDEPPALAFSCQRCAERTFGAAASG